MLMVIFGAGASWDSVNLAIASESRRVNTWMHYQPPLAKDLFADCDPFNAALDEYRRSRVVAHRMRGIGDAVNIEVELERFLDEAAEFPERHIQLAATRFYLRRILSSCSREWEMHAHGVTNYLALVDALRRRLAAANDELLLVTFNYDNLLETAWADETGSAIETIDDYLDHRERTSIIKVHGSIDWARRVVPLHASVRTDKDLIDHAPELSITDEYVYAGDGTLVPSAEEQYFPALAIPVRSKTYFECPELHLQALIDGLPSVTHLLVIGWAGADDHFLRLCADHQLSPAHTMVVCGSAEQASGTVMALDGIGISNGLEVFNGGFSALVTSGRDQLEIFFKS